MNRGLSIQIASLIIGTVLIGQALGCDPVPELVLNIANAHYIPAVNKWYAPINEPLIFDLSNSVPSQGTWLIRYLWSFGDSHWYHEADYEDWSFGFPPDLVWYKEGDCAYERETNFPEQGPIEGGIDGKHGHTYTQTGTYQVMLTITEYDPVNGVPGNSRGVAITIVIVDVSISGSSGIPTLIAVNNDDDNSNQVIDCTTTEFNVTGEDDLVAITAGLSPVASCSGVGYVKLSIVNLPRYLEDDLFLWKNQTKNVDTRLIPDDGNFYCTFPPQRFPAQPMYVEAVSTAGSAIYVLIEYYIYNDLLVSKMSGFTISKMNMNTSGVTESQESMLGAFIPFNDDDDNNNEIADKDDTSTVSGEDDLVSLSNFSLIPATLPIDQSHPVTLEATAGSSNIKIYANQDKSGGSISLPITFTDRNTMENAQYWIEGCQVSNSPRDITLKLYYEGSVIEDYIKMTVVKVDLDMDGVEDAKETKVGGFIALNDDDDDDNHTADKDESGPITNEDNLVKITLRQVEPSGLTGNVTLKSSAGIQVWNGATKGGSPISLPATYATPADLPKELYIEGASTSSNVRDKELSLEYEIAGKTLKDIIKVTVIDVQSVDVDVSGTDTYKIASVLPAAQIPDDHFVTVQGLPGDIVLKATITPDTAETREKITWPTMTQDGSDKLKATKSRVNQGEYPATVDVCGKDARDLVNWVVWASYGTSANAINEYVGTFFTTISGGYDVLDTISPGSIIIKSDRPDLTGSNSGNPPNVPAIDTDVANKGDDLSGGADRKWDSSRQIRENIFNPNGLNFSNFPGDIEFYTSYLNYPSDDTCGNDDQGTDDEYNDPYNSPYQGGVFGEDAPTQTSPHSEGSLGDTWEMRVHMRGFARLELGGKWYRISGWCLWKVHLKFKKQNESEAAWGKDFNGDGNFDDVVPVWRDNGSFIALDNEDFD